MSTSESPGPDPEVRMQLLTKLSVTKRNAMKHIMAADGHFDIRDEAQARKFREEWSRQMEYWLVRKFQGAPRLETIIQRSTDFINAWEGSEGDQEKAKRVREQFLESVVGLTLVMKPRRVLSQHQRANSARMGARSAEANSDRGSEGEADEEGVEHSNPKVTSPAMLRVHMLVTLLRLRNIQQSTVAQA
ncbi:hypothetical protein BGX21_008652 [Mortierella sp. AD011]|nr:hypothetical protein BGX20_008707 [Mortierella sp. AD010]KAF9397638.1 hypothetical protein BGX21_008652 [Mortierella sp. AD011]